MNDAERGNLEQYFSFQPIFKEKSLPPHTLRRGDPIGFDGGWKGHFGRKFQSRWSWVHPEIVIPKVSN
jgi:hypothetical protein